MSWLPDWQLSLAATAGLVAFIILLLLIVAPRPKVVSRSRRRPGVVQQAGPLSGVAERVTGGVDRVLTSRNSALAERLELAGIKTPASHYVVLTGSATLAAVALGLLLRLPLLALVMLVAVPLVSVLIVSLRTDHRRTSFSNQLDETAQMLAGGLRSGYSFPQAMAAVGREAQAPTNEEFVRITNELRLGRSLAETMENTARRMRSEDFSWIGQAVTINREVGGNLADVLDNVSQTIRQRAQLRRQVQSLSAEGRLSAIVLVLLPFVILGLLLLVNPGYVGVLFTNVLGWVIIGLAVVLLVVGSLWLRSVVRIKY
ncbi:type II secretion system F family protein [Aestuariimicrobium soli]|uniref:type II secretion system F family protein n=1 Tax=Aestuariimicrobium soli TaxID=2035834 RepID=UPI003EBB7C69